MTANTTCVFDSLESRRLFSVTLDSAGVLNILGTAHGDTITVYSEPKHPENLDVKLNGQVTQFNRADVKSLFIRTFRGNDFINIGYGSKNKLDEALSSRIYADGGSDLVGISSGAARVFGGDGDDRLICNDDHSRCTLYGEAGNDQLQGSNADDLLVGGDGNDSLWGSYGRDTIDGGAGDDTIQRSWDGDQLYGGSGNDSVLGTDSSDPLIDQTSGDMVT